MRAELRVQLCAPRRTKSRTPCRALSARFCIAHACDPFAGVRRTRLSRRASSSEFLRQHQHLARARHVGPVAVEIGDQPLHVRPLHRAIQRGLIGKLIHRVMQRWIGEAPVAPRLHGAERFHRIRQMLARIPGVERLTFGRIGHGGADDEKGCRHFILPRIVLVGWAERSVPTIHQRQCKKWWARRKRAFAHPTHLHIFHTQLSHAP